MEKERNVVRIPKKESDSELKFWDFAEKCPKRKDSAESQYTKNCSDENGEVLHECWDFKCKAYEKACFEIAKERLSKIGITVLQEGEHFIEVELPEGWSKEYTDHSMWYELLDEKRRKRAGIFEKCTSYEVKADFNFCRRFSISYEVADYNKEDFQEKPRNIISGYKKAMVDEDGNAFTGEDSEDVYYEYDRKGFTVEMCIAGKSLNRYKVVDIPIYEPNPEYVPLPKNIEKSQPIHHEVRDHDGTVLFKSASRKTDFEYSEDRHYEFYEHRESMAKESIRECQEWLEKNYPDYQDVFAYWN